MSLYFSVLKRFPFALTTLVASSIAPAIATAQTGTIVASNMNAASVSIVDVASGTTIATIPCGDGPHEVAVSHSGRWAVVSIYGGRTAIGQSLLVIDVTDPSKTRSIELGAGNQRPHGVQFSPDDKTLMVTGERAQRVLFVDFTTGQIDSSLVTGQAATHMVALTKDGRRAFTTNITAMTVSSIDVPGRKVRETFQVGKRIEGLAVTPDGREVWVGGNDSQSVFVLNGQTGVIEHTLTGFGMAYRVGITPDGKTAVISDPGAEKIHLYDVASHTAKAVIDVPKMDGPSGAGTQGSSPQGITISRDGKTAFVTLKAAAKVAVIDVATAKITGTLPVGADPDGVGYSPLTVKR